MARATPVYSQPHELTRCGVCNEIIHEPKSLPCLHTFCLECLREWSKSSREHGESVICPIATCKKVTPMPSNGVEGLPGNVFVSSLIDRSPLRGKLVPCVCCKETNNKVLARCFECKGFLCERGVDLHQEPLLESHQVIMLDDIKSGKVDLKLLADKSPPTCNEHEKQQLWLYCTTCGVLICRDCTVVDHPKPDHNYVTLKSIAKEQRLKIKTLINKSADIKERINKGLNDTAEVKKKLNINFHNVIGEIDTEIAKIKKHVDKLCKEERNRLINQHEKSALLSEKSIAATNQALQQQKSQFQTAPNMALQALQNGSDYDIASVYRQLSSSILELCKMEPMRVPRIIAELPKFNAYTKIFNITSIGTIPETESSFEPSVGTISEPEASHEPNVKTTPLHHISSGTWKLKNKFAKIDVRGASTTPTGDIVIANRVIDAPIEVFSSSGDLKLTLDKESSCAWNVVVNSAGQFYGSCGDRSDSNVIRMFESDGRYISQFPAISTTGVASDAEDTDLRGLAINHKSQLLIGEVNTNYISIHESNGVHVTTFRVSTEPFSIATTSTGNIVVSPFGHSCVKILDCNGYLKYIINAPKDVTDWWPNGVCCSINDEICISNNGTRKGVYCFTSTGEYLRRITKDVKCPCGVTLFDNDQKMVVADDDCVKIFRRK